MFIAISLHESLSSHSSSSITSPISFKMSGDSPETETWQQRMAEVMWRTQLPSHEIGKATTIGTAPVTPPPSAIDEASSLDDASTVDETSTDDEVRIL
jgi:hypothetical protein